MFKERASSTLGRAYKRNPQTPRDDDHTTQASAGVS
jgi:hypothetical protein